MGMKGLSIPILAVLLICCYKICQGQDYILEDINDQAYIQKPRSFADLSADLQTSDLALHHQQRLPQYKSQPIPKYPFQNSFYNAHESSDSIRDYVKPSTHRPDYSYLFSNENTPNYLQTEPVYESLTTNNPVRPRPFAKSDQYETKNTVETEMKRSTSNGNDERNNNLSNESFEYDNEDSQNNKSENGSNKKQNENDIEDDEEEEYEEEYPEDEESEEDTYYDDEQLEDSKEAKNDTYEVLTVKPMVTTQENTFQNFVDTNAMDTTTQELASSEVDTQTPKLAIPVMKKTNSTNENKVFPELVVSVVTSKTIVNNTIISPVGLTQLPTEIPMSSGAGDETVTDSWIVVASVQTSKSISGARYLPSSLIEQHQRNRLLNEPEEPESEVTDDQNIVDSTTTELPYTNLELSTKIRTSTESLIDKLDRVQSDLSSGLLADGFKNDNIAVINENAPTTHPVVTSTTLMLPVTTKLPYPQVNIRKFDAGSRALRTKSKETKHRVANKPFFSSTVRPSIRPEPTKDISSLFSNAKPVNELSNLLPPGYKLPTSEEDNVSTTPKKTNDEDILNSLLPPGYVAPKATITTESPLAAILGKAKPVDDLSALLPPGYKAPRYNLEKKSSITDVLAKAKPVEDLSALLPPGFKPKAEDQKEPNEQNINAGGKLSKVLTNAQPVADISSLLPPGYKPPKQSSTEKSLTNLLSKAKPLDDISSLLPAGYKAKTYDKKGYKGVSEETSPSIPSSLLPKGYGLDSKNDTDNVAIPVNNSSKDEGIISSTAKSKEVKLVFPSRPGAGTRKSSRLTTAKTTMVENRPPSPTIQKGWPIRSSTEFTGWPTPSTTPISIEKLLEAARMAHTSTTTDASTTSSSTTTTPKPTTTTMKATTAGVCIGECDLAGTIKLVAGAKWVPELLDRNTKEYQILANDVQSELENIYSSSPVLQNWYRKIRIDGFSEGSVLVDYLVELNEIGQKVNTQEIKNLFNDSLQKLRNNANREGKSLNETKSLASLGRFEVDTKYTDFVVIPKQSYPTVSYAEDSIMLPQWAIAIIVIGLASLLFVIIFGVTVLLNRHKSAKKTPVPLTEDMLNELNKNHMGGIENYGSDELYNMEDVWADNPYEQKPQKKRGNESIYDNSMTNLYDSWQSQWNGNGTYDNRHEWNSNYSHDGRGGTRRPKYDPNF